MRKSIPVTVWETYGPNNGVLAKASADLAAMTRGWNMGFMQPLNTVEVVNDGGTLYLKYVINDKVKAPF